MNILHITDLHISEPITSEKTTQIEGLRDSFYEEYLEGLISNIDENIDYMVVTGDLVDRSNFDNYKYVCKIINHLGTKLSISDENIFIINGNHDVPRDTGCLDKFNEFLSKFDKNKKVLCKGERYKLYSCAKSKTGFLCLDSIGGNYAKGTPSNLTQYQEDDIVSSVKENQFDELIVLSHHPAASYDLQNQAPFDEDDDEWSKNHIWSCGGNLFKRLSSATNVKKSVYWFSGDVHRPEFTIIEQRMYLIVGSSCNSVSGVPQGIPPTVTVLSIGESDRKQLVSYAKNTEGHYNRSLAGEWSQKAVDPKYFGAKDTSVSIARGEKQHSEEEPVHHEEVKEPAKANEGFTLVDKTIEKQLLDNVIERDLYHFGRFENRSDLVSLGWVSISNILNDSSLYLKVINSFKKQIESIIGSANNINKKSCIILGLDHWGSILSSRLGAALNIGSCCVATDGDNREYDTREILNDELKDIFSKKNIVFCISDVISTGHTIKAISNSNLYNEDSNWYNLCILFDPVQNRPEHTFDRFSHTYYLCGGIKLPIIDKVYLPDTPLLQPQSHILR